MVLHKYPPPDDTQNEMREVVRGNIGSESSGDANISATIGDFVDARNVAESPSSS